MAGEDELSNRNAPVQDAASNTATKVDTHWIAAVAAVTGTATIKTRTPKMMGVPASENTPIETSVVPKWNVRRDRSEVPISRMCRWSRYAGSMGGWKCATPRVMLNSLGPH
jgi:hypothetical protein